MTEGDTPTPPEPAPPAEGDAAPDETDTEPAEPSPLDPPALNEAPPPPETDEPVEAPAPPPPPPTREQILALVPDPATQPDLPPGMGVNYGDAATVAGVFDTAAALNLNSPLRRGAMVCLPTAGTVLMTGDLHDHALNLERILKLAALDKADDRFLLMHEIIHGKNRVNGRDFSVRTLARIAAVTLQYPGRAFHLQSNHELAQLAGAGILKGGVSVVESFDEGIDYIYGSDADLVRQAMLRYIRSLPLAARLPSGILCSHSLPSPKKLSGFDDTVLLRTPTDSDLAFGGAAYNLVWGRDHDQTVADELAESWNLRLFITGHQPADGGYFTEGDAILVLASDHDWGVALPIELDKDYTLDALIERIVPLAQVDLENAGKA